MSSIDNFTIRLVTQEDLPDLDRYLNQLSEETRKRYGPHPFNLPTLQQLYLNQDDHRGYIVISEGEIVAYTVVKLGYVDHDKQRLMSYGYELDHSKDCTIAPSVADAWQSKGVGGKMFKYVLDDLAQLGFKRVILWGGVQATNERAKRLYGTHGFQLQGQFENNGQNYDMVLEL